MSHYGDLHIIDLGAHRPSHCRYALGTAEARPDGEPGRWVRIAAVPMMARWRIHLPRVGTEGVDEIITVGDGDEVTGI